MDFYEGMELSSAAYSNKIWPTGKKLKTSGPKHIDKELTRDVFEKLCENLIERCRIPVEKALNDARLDKSDINEVVLVGGSTRIPAIQELVESLTK